MKFEGVNFRGFEGFCLLVGMLFHGRGFKFVGGGGGGLPMNTTKIEPHVYSNDSTVFARFTQ